MKGTPLVPTRTSPVFQVAASPRRQSTPRERRTPTSCSLPLTAGPPPPLALPANLTGVCASPARATRSADAIADASFGSMEASPPASKSLGALPESCVRAHYLCPDSHFKMCDMGPANGTEIIELKDSVDFWLPEPKRYIQRLNLSATFERYVAYFSERFEAMCVRWEHRFVWFTRVDDASFAFRLACSKFDEDIHISDSFDPLRCVTIPGDGIRWSDLQQHLVEHFEDDNHVRAILAACVMSFGFDINGKYSCVHNELIPDKMRCFEPCIVFDVPIDDDILTLLADPRVLRDDQLYFECAKSYYADVVSSNVPGVAHLKRREAPCEAQMKGKLSSCSIPLLYGYGTFLNCLNDPERTVHYTKLVDKVKKSKRLVTLLATVREKEPVLYNSGKLDLTAIAESLHKSNGAPLPVSRKKIRRLTGRTLMVFENGLTWKEPLVKPRAVNGNLAANFIAISFGTQVQWNVGPEDTKPVQLSEIAEYILGEETNKYVGQERFGQYSVCGPMGSLWADATAVANSLVALLARKYGLFEGFAACAARERHVRRRCLLHPMVMDADIFLPMLHAFDPQLRKEIDCRTQTMFVEGRTVLLHNNPFKSVNRMDVGVFAGAPCREPMESENKRDVRD